MARLLELWSKEPARIVGLVVALLALLVAFGVPISSDQQQAIVGIAVAVLAVLGAEITRSQVYAPATVENIRNEMRTDAIMRRIGQTPAPGDPPGDISTGGG